MDKDIKKAEERIEYLSSDPETIELYRAREASLHERANLISTGREEGKKEGRYEVAINAIKEGMPLDLINKLTIISIEELTKLQKEINK